MTNNNGSLTLIDDLVTQVQDGESLLTKKSNTVTAGIGGLITLLLTGGSYWLEIDADAPSWLPKVVLILGMLATTYGVSKTKNGMTDSVAKQLHRELAQRIDMTHYHGPEEQYLEFRDPAVVPEEDTPEYARTLREAADSLTAQDDAQH